MPANVIIKSDERRAQESAMLRAFGGGHEGNTSNAGPSALNLNNPRSNVRTNIGFFSAYPFSQTGKFTDFSQCKKGKRDLFQFRS